MRTHKLTLCAFAAIAALATACSNDEPAGNDIPQEGIIIEATANILQKSVDTRLTHTDNTTKMDIKWAASDAYTVYESSSNKTDYAIKAGDENKTSASFTGTWSVAPAAGASLVAIYPTNATVDPAAISLTLDGQDGTLDDLKRFNYMTAPATNDNGALSFSFTHQVAIVKLALTFPSGVTGDATGVGLSATGLNKSLQMDLTNGNSTSSKVAGDITTGTNALTIGTDGKLTAYLCVFPGALTDAKVVATAGGKNYEAALSKLTVVAGSMYTATVTVTEAAAADFITVNGIKVAVGNLVANGSHGAKIGAATDNGLFFQFGSLVGWSDKEPLAIVVKPATCNVTVWSSSWTGASNPSTNPDTKDEVAGTGDPCRYYLGGTWRLPTGTEFETLFNTDDNTYKNGWSWDAPSSYASHSSGLKFPASGYRSDGNGILDSVGSSGSFWSTSPNETNNGYYLDIYDSYVDPSSFGNRAYGFAVRCVRD